MKKVALVVRHSPGSELGTREMVDMALVLATFDCPVTVVFQDQGVLWANLPAFPNDHPSALSGRIKSMPLYDIEQIWVDTASLAEFKASVHPEFPGQPMTRDQIQAALRTIDCVLEA